MDAAYELSNFVVDTRFEELPHEALDVAKKEVLDSIATTLGGSTDESAKKLYELVKEWGGRQESTIIAHEGKFPSPNAALVNSTMANALDYDDVHERANFHAGNVVVPSAFALSEAIGSVHGKEFITAVCAAVELGCRLGIATRPSKPIFMGGWDYGVLHGYFTGAAVAGKILNLDREKMHNALGIAYNQVAGNGQSMRDGADTKKIGYGFASHGGITSALMAERGITGAKDIFDETDTGFYSLYHAGCNSTALLKDLGQKFEMTDMSFKPYPCCRMNHPYIDAIMKLLKDNKIEANEIEEIVPFTCKYVYQTLCVPEQVKKRPNNVITTQFSLPWTIACAVVRRRVGISEFTNDALNDSLLLDMASKVSPILDSSLSDELVFTKIKLRTKRGTFEIQTDYALGGVHNPMTFDDIEHKLLDCASASARHISKVNLTRVASMVRNLEEVKNVKELIKLLI